MAREPAFLIRNAGSPDFRRLRAPVTHERSGYGGESDV